MYTPSERTQPQVHSQEVLHHMNVLCPYHIHPGGAPPKVHSSGTCVPICTLTKESTDYILQRQALGQRYPSVCKYSTKCTPPRSTRHRYIHRRCTPLNVNFIGKYLALGTLIHGVFNQMQAPARTAWPEGHSSWKYRILSTANSSGKCSARHTRHTTKHSRGACSPTHR